jgi:bifunctional non-homologous end joining protein LigD
VLADMGLMASAKVSGSAGLQLYVPLRPGHAYAHTKPFARAVARTLATARPDLVVDKMDKRLRPGRVLVDWSQNDATKSTIAVYSLRARPAPTVSMPVDWGRIDAVAAGDPADEVLRFTPAAAVAALEAVGDRFGQVLAGDQVLPGADLGSIYS